MEKGPTERVPNTPVRPNVLSTYLDGYDPEKAAYLINGFSEGFRIESEGLEGECLMVDNPRLPEHLRTVLEKKLRKEIDAGRILGPFDDAPFPNLRVSPIKVAPKKTLGDFRFIHNLSHPYDKEAVNTSIPRDKVSVQYSTVDDAISHIKEVGVGAHLAKTDIKSAFRIVPIHPDDHHHHEVEWGVLLRYYFTYGVFNVLCHLRVLLHCDSVDSKQQIGHPKDGACAGRFPYNRPQRSP